jgi:hypothetical protein
LTLKEHTQEEVQEIFVTKKEESLVSLDVEAEELLKEEKALLCNTAATLSLWVKLKEAAESLKDNEPFN